MASKRKETNTKVTSVRAEGEGGGSLVSSPSAVNTDRSTGQILSAACLSCGGQMDRARLD